MPETAGLRCSLGNNLESIPGVQEGVAAQRSGSQFARGTANDPHGEFDVFTGRSLLLWKSGQPVHNRSVRTKSLVSTPLGIRIRSLK
jgi:hypothetical protein